MFPLHVSISHCRSLVHWCNRRPTWSSWGWVGWVGGRQGVSLTPLRAQSSQLWSTSRHSWQNWVLVSSARDPRKVDATRLRSSVFHWVAGLSAASWRKMQSYLHHPFPLYLCASLTTRWAYVSISCVIWSTMHMAQYATKQYIHVMRDDISRGWDGRGGSATCWLLEGPGCICSRCWSREMLSVSKSFISTNCPLLILSTSWAGKGWANEVSTRGTAVGAVGTLVC